jgi:hypothetical protein
MAVNQEAQGPTSTSGDPSPRLGTTGQRPLARPLDIEHVFAPDHEAMVAALRVVLGLPRQLPDRGQRGVR